MVGEHIEFHDRAPDQARYNLWNCAYSNDCLDFIVGTPAPVVVFGGGFPSGSFGGALVQTATSGPLVLNNTGDTIFVRLPNLTLIDSYSYGSEAAIDESLTWDLGFFVPHTSHPSGVGLFSPGTEPNGVPFSCGARGHGKE